LEPHGEEREKKGSHQTERKGNISRYLGEKRRKTGESFSFVMGWRWGRKGREGAFISGKKIWSGNPTKVTYESYQSSKKGGHIEICRGGKEFWGSERKKKEK